MIYFYAFMHLQILSTIIHIFLIPVYYVLIFFILIFQFIENNLRTMLTSYSLPQSTDINYTVTILQMKNQELSHDNLVLTKQIYRLRQIIAYYQQKFVSFRKVEQYHNEQVQQINKNKKQILERIQKSDGHTSIQISNKLKQLKKQVFYKKAEQLQNKYEKKNQQCEQLLQFKSKIQRLRNTWDLKSKQKADANNLQSLFIWVYNQIVKNKAVGQSKGKKNQMSSSKQLNKQNRNQKSSDNIMQKSNMERNSFKNSTSMEMSKTNRKQSNKKIPVN